jgi:hypothetical protein
MTHDDELTPQERFYAENPERTVPRDLARGCDREKIIAGIVRLGWTRENAAALVDRAAADLEKYRSSPEGRREVLGGAVREMIGGLLIFLFGVCATVSTVLSALAFLSKYWFFPIGLIAFGLALFVRGYTRWTTYRGTYLAGREEDRSSN